MTKKYELTDDWQWSNGKKVYRIKALRNIGNRARAGDLGGFVETEDNLSQEGDCWIGYGKKYDGGGVVNSTGRVTDNAYVCGQAQVSTGGIVKGNAKVYGRVLIFEEVRV
jgi:hypothetical protein